jgi:hypothetical protein
VYARLRGGGGFRLGDIGRGGDRIVTADLELSNGVQSRFDCVSMIFRGICIVVSSPGPEGGSMEYGFISGESATVRMLSRLLAALAKDSPDAASGEVARDNGGERGRAEPDPETENRLLRERTALAARGVTGRERKLGDLGGEETSSVEDTACFTLLAPSDSSGALKGGLVGEESISCIRIDSITSKSPRGSGTPDGLDGIPRPARTDLQGKVIRNLDGGHGKTDICVPLAKDGALYRVYPALRHTRI